MLGEKTAADEEKPVKKKKEKPVKVEVSNLRALDGILHWYLKEELKSFLLAFLIFALL